MAVSFLSSQEKIPLHFSNDTPETLLQKKKKKKRKSADPEDYNCIIASCSFPCISFSSHAAGFDTDLEDGWCEFSAIHILVQKENSLSVLKDNMSM